MSPWVQRMVFVLAFVAACVLFRLGYRRVRRPGPPQSLAGSFRWAFATSLAMLIGCSGARPVPGGPAPAGAGSDAATEPGPAAADVPAAVDAGAPPEAATADGGPPPGPDGASALVLVGPKDLGDDFHEVWAELMQLWQKAEDLVASEDLRRRQIERAETDLDALLARLGGLERVTSDAPGLLALVRREFERQFGQARDRLPAEPPPEGVTCYAPMPPPVEGRAEFNRISMRLEAFEQLAAAGYVNDWLKNEALARLGEDLDVLQRVRAGLGTDPWYGVEPAAFDAVIGRAEAVLRRYANP